MMALIIDEIEAWACTLPLSQPLDFGAFQIVDRKHTVVRVRTADGLVAECIGQSRGAPIDVALLDVIAPLCLGQSALDYEAIRRRVVPAMNALELEGTIGRAWSLMDICLHDLRAQAAGWPLWRLLGGDPEPVTAKMVEGYALVGESNQAFAGRLVERVEQGYRILKVEAAHYSRHEEILERLRFYQSALSTPAKLVLDFAWTWRDVKSQLSLLQALETLPIGWIEDPFARTNVQAYRELRDATGHAVGCGDEATRPADLIRLINERAVDVLRLDATTIGGIEAARRICHQARTAGLRVSFHEHPEIHEHLVFGLDSADHVEIFPLDRPFDRVHDLWQSTIFDRIDAGRLHPPTTPGTGIRLITDAVEHYAVRHGRVSS